jgi:hypothetical protein
MGLLLWTEDFMREDLRIWERTVLDDEGTPSISGKRGLASNTGNWLGASANRVAGAGVWVRPAWH